MRLITKPITKKILHCLRILGLFDREAIMYQAAHYELVASTRAVKIGHEINPDFQIGCMIAMCPIYPATCNPKDILMAQKAMEKRYYFADVHVHGYYPNHILKYWQRKEIKVDVTEEDLADLTAGTVDYIVFSYYMSFAIDAHRDNNPHFDYLETEDLVRNPYVKVSEWNWKIDPEGLHYRLNWFTDMYHLPLFIVENGFGAIDQVEADGMVHDNYRIAYLGAHIKERWSKMPDAVTRKQIDYQAFLNRESQKHHHRYDEELQQYSYLKNGDLENAIKATKQMFQSDLTGHLSENPVRNYQYLFVALVTLATRFAIQGGLDDEVAFNTSDLYIQKVDKLDNVPDVFDL